jgi:Family of unknown function (DUF5343)
MPEEQATSFTPPYISFSQLENTLNRMNTEGVPTRVDRSYLGSWSGSAQGQFLAAARSLGLIDPEFGRPTERLKAAVANPEQRPELIGAIIREKYPEALALGERATQQQLDEVFRNYPGISGATTRKAITFYLHACKFAGIPLSPFFKAARASGSSSPRPRRPRPPAQQQQNGNGAGTNLGGQAADPEQRKQYITLLMKMIEEKGVEADPALLTRLEWLLGYRTAPPDES